MKCLCPRLGIEYMADSGTLSHKRITAIHPLFHVPDKEFVTYLSSRYWRGYTDRERSILATILFRRTECVAPESAPFILPSPLVNQFWGRFQIECEWLMRMAGRNLQLPRPGYRFFRAPETLSSVFEGWLPAVEVIHEDFRNNVTYRYDEDATRARVLAAQRRMSKKMMVLEESHGQLPPNVVAYILDSIAPMLPIENPAHMEQQKKRRAYMLTLMLPDVKLLAAIHAKQLQLDQCLKLLDTLETWQLHDVLRYKTVRILRRKIEFLADMTNLVLDADAFVGAFVEKFNKSFTIIAPQDAPTIMPELAAFGTDRIGYMRAMAKWRLMQQAQKHKDSQSSQEIKDNSHGA